MTNKQLTCESCGRSGRLSKGLCFRCSAQGHTQIEESRGRKAKTKSESFDPIEDDYSEESNPDSVHISTEDYMTGCYDKWSDK